MREALEIHRQERRDNPQASDRYGHIRFPRFVQYVAAFKGWPVALACAGIGLLLSLFMVALGVAGAVVGIYLGRDFEPAPLALGALIAFASSLVAGEVLLRRRPWRRLLSIAATAGSSRRPGTMGLGYRVGEADPIRIKHALLSDGFAYVTVHRTSDDGFGGRAQIEVVIAPGTLSEPEAKARIEATLEALGASYRATGGSYS